MSKAPEGRLAGECTRFVKQPPASMLGVPELDKCVMCSKSEADHFTKELRALNVVRNLQQWLSDTDEESWSDDHEGISDTLNDNGFCVPMSNKKLNDLGDSLNKLGHKLDADVALVLIHELQERRS